MQRFIAAALFLAVAASSAFAQPKAAAESAKPAGTPMKPGLWEIVTANETVGSPVKRTMTARTCYSADDVASVARMLPQQREFGMKCELKDAKAQGVAATWRVACAGKDATLAGTGKMTMAADSFAGQTELELKKAGTKPAKVEQKVTGKLVDPTCK